MIHCVYFKKPAIDIVSIEVRDFPECVLSAWFPIIEPDLGQERFLADDPAELFRTGSFYKVPLVIGRSTDEFVNPVIRIMISLLSSLLSTNCNICRCFGEQTAWDDE